MANINLTNGETYTFAKVNGNAVITHASDHAATPFIIRNDLNLGLNASNPGNFTLNVYSDDVAADFTTTETSDATPTVKIRNTTANADSNAFIQFHTQQDNQYWAMGIDADDENGAFALYRSSYLVGPTSALRVLRADTDGNVYLCGAPHTGLYIGNNETSPITSNNFPADLDPDDIEAHLIVRGTDQEKVNLIAAYGTGQSDGMIYVGQSSGYGGGIIYRGDGTHPSEISDATQDRISFYRTNDSVMTEVMNYSYSSNNVSVVGTLTDGVSDKRLKENVKEIDNAIDKINRIRGVYFDYNKSAVDVGFISQDDFEKSKRNVGVIAQEIEKVLPEVVSPAPCDSKWKSIEHDGREQYKTVNYENIVPLLIEGIKEQQDIINNLKKRIERLENK